MSKFYNWLDNDIQEDKKPKKREVNIKEKRLPKNIEVISDNTAKAHWRIK